VFFQFPFSTPETAGIGPGAAARRVESSIPVLELVAQKARAPTGRVTKRFKSLTATIRGKTRTMAEGWRNGHDPSDGVANQARVARRVSKIGL